MIGSSVRVVSLVVIVTAWSKVVGSLQYAVNDHVAARLRSKYSESVKLLGQGYNIVAANPHTIKLGEIPLFGSAPDPGYTKARIFKQSWSGVDKTDEVQLPDHVVLKPWVGEKCRQELDHEMIPGIKAYQRLLLANTVKAPRNPLLPRIGQCKRTSLGEDYHGTKKVTVTGKTCLKWGTEEHNFCRNPDRRFVEGPSCFVEKSQVEPCYIPFCEPEFGDGIEYSAFLGPYYTKQNDTKNDGTNTNEYIYFESKRTCSEGSVELDMDSANDLEVTEEFKMAACDLPVSLEGPKTHLLRKFIEKFGTSIIIGADVGIIWLQRTESEREKLFDSVRQLFNDTSTWASTSIRTVSEVEANRNKTSQYLALDLEKMPDEWRRNISQSSRSSNAIEWLSGSSDTPKPISLTLIRIDQALDEKYWQRECSQPNSTYSECCADLEAIQFRLKFEIIMYSIELGDLPRSLLGEEFIAAPLKWPSGVYALPASGSTCPGEDWLPGSVYHGTHYKNELSENITAAASEIVPTETGSGLMYRIHLKFCSKVNASDGPEWPKGSYCIHRLGDCPNGFKEGYIGWTDVYPHSANRIEGSLPDGQYGVGKHLKLEYCCRNDGSTNVPILLPTDKPFYLMMIAEECQQVFGMTATKQWVFWDSSDMCFACYLSSQQGGLHPKNDYYYENNKLYYCLYQSTQ